MIKISSNTQQALNDSTLQRNLGRSLLTTANYRDEVLADEPGWEELRQFAHDVQAHTLSRLDHYLQKLEQNLLAQGVQVVWAENGEEAVQLIADLAHGAGVDWLVKSKSMTSEEIDLEKSLERQQIRSVETDLGDFIVQLAGEKPSHIVAPALHKSKEEIRDLFVDLMKMEPAGDVEEITGTSRVFLRERFLETKIAVTGVNFAVAESGTLVIVENEGNAGLCAAVPEVHVALMGIEKVIPRTTDLVVLLKLLIRSGTGQKMTSYVNLLGGPGKPGEEGPKQRYLVLIDNGRSKILADQFLRQTLSCVRCGACLNFCPVYQSIGGHAYGSTYPGPIGSILTPQLQSPSEAPEHPFVSSLCGACRDVCPVKIDIPSILLRLREEVQRDRNSRASRFSLEKVAFRIWAWIMSSPGLYARTGGWGRALRRIPWPTLPGTPPARWGENREMPELPRRSFRELHTRQRREP